MNSMHIVADGRLGAPPELRTSAKGRPWASFGLAVNQDSEVVWLSVAVFGDLISELPADLNKGERIHIEGRLTLSHWEKNGEKRITLRVAASQVVVLDRIGRRARRRRRRGAGFPNLRRRSGAAAGGREARPPKWSLLLAVWRRPASGA
jgi:single-strand DNA-binding protein